MKVFLPSIILLLFLASGCSTGKKAFEKGQYDRAVYQAVKRMQSNPDSKKARATLANAYSMARARHLDNVNRAESSSDPFRWEQVVQGYESVNALYAALRNCPACLEEVPAPTNYDRPLATAREKAAIARYDMGVRALTQRENRDKAIEAHGHFMTALDYVPGYKDAEKLRDQAYYYATLKVVVNPVPRPSRRLAITHDFFVDKINEYLHHQRFNPYVQFYTQEEAHAQGVKDVDHVVYMSFDDFVLGNVNRDRIEREVTRDSVVVGQVEGQDVLGTVKATVEITRISLTGGGVLDFRIVDGRTKKALTSEKFPSEYIWEASWATYKGDERALNDEEVRLTQRREVGLPSPQEVFREFTVPLYDQIINKINNFYRNY